MSRSGIGPVRKDLDLGVVTHVGMVRSENQDSFRFFEPPEDEEFRRKGRLLVVCDGMGGHNGGTVASKTTADAVVEIYQRSAVLNLRRLLGSAIERANQRVRELGAKDASLRNMGTTCVAIAVRGPKVQVASIGDSRAYLLRGKKMEQVTRDHTYLNDLIDIGLLTPEKAKNHPERNIITRCVGMGETLQVDFMVRDAEPGDSWLLCSDGLYNHVEAEEMRDILLAEGSQVACQKLVELANVRGGEDNITVGVVKIVEVGKDFVSADENGDEEPPPELRTPVIALEDPNRTPRSDFLISTESASPTPAPRPPALGTRFWKALVVVLVALVAALLFWKSRY